jgi:hypothetical protein
MNLNNMNEALTINLKDLNDRIYHYQISLKINWNNIGHSGKDIAIVKGAKPSIKWHIIK